MSAARAFLFLIFGFTMLKFICGYSDGSLLINQCQNMDIIHSGQQPTGQDSNPFTVVPDNVTVGSLQVGTSITVTLSASSGSFLGFMLEARECDDCPPAGTFSLLDSANSLLLCDGQAVAQTDNSDKYSLQVTWTPQGTGYFFFRAAFVQVFGSFWTKKAIILPTTTTLPLTTTPMTTSPLVTTPRMMQTMMQTTMPTMTQTTTQATTPSTTQAMMQTTTPTMTQTTTTTQTMMQTTTLTPSKTLTTLQMMMTTATTTTTDTTTTVTTCRTTLDASTAPPTSAVNNTQTGLTVFTTPNLQATVNTTQTDSTTNTTITSNTQSQTTVTPSYLLQCVQYLRSCVALLLFSRLCFLGGSSLLMIIKPVSKMLTQIASIIELIFKTIATVLVLIKAVHYDCENAGLQFVFAALTVTAMVTGLMHTITVFLHRGLSHELRTCWIGSLIIVDLLNTLMTSISIFYGLWWFQGRWLLIVMAVYVILEFILHFGAVVYERMEKHKTRMRVEQNRPVPDNRKSPWFFIFAICLVIYVMFTVALIVGVVS
ncbi:uncharacterized protein LOC130233612 [Danio aesculapii]|uniref:uncharacterized protein LOC130233612 n=1 Tax=Danio aesculapii TaxID=1142201 RepID=UPI0024BFF91F|nr:uncharacterized protein LOC130233612 [Danio aesculapii]